MFAAWTSPEHVRRWWGPRGYDLAVCEIDLRPGGRYRYVQRDAQGNEFPFKGEFREIDPPAASCTPRHSTSNPSAITPP